MDSPRLGCSSGGSLRCAGQYRQLPASGGLGAATRLRPGCRRLARASAARGVSAAMAGTSSDAAASSSAGPAGRSGPTIPQTRQQREDAAHQVVQRLTPPTPVASATKLTPAGVGVNFGGVALGILLTVALQLAGRWLQRQPWAQQVLEVLDLRRSSGSSTSTSGSSARDGSDSDSEMWDWFRNGSGSSAGGASERKGGGSSGGKGSGGRSASGNLDGDSTGTSTGSTSAFRGGRGPAGGGSNSLGGTPFGSVDGGTPPNSPSGAGTLGISPLPPGADPGETVEWVNMCWRKVWRVYQRGLERWIIDLLQPVFDGLVKDGSVPRWLCRLRVVELTLDHEAPYFSNMRRRNSRKDSDLNGVVDLRYTGGARMLLMLELGEGRWRFKVPVLVSDLDLECQMWLKLRLAPMCPWIGTISLAFVGPPNVKVQLSPYNRVRLMRVPVVQNYLRKLLTVELPGLMVLPQRLEINIPPSVTTIAEAAVGRDTIMRAVASAVLQADAVEAALLAALPLGPQTPAGGVTLPDSFTGELTVTLREARNLPVWGFPGQSNPYCRLVLGDQAVQSRREGDTSHPGRHRAPVWNQEFQFLVEDPDVQVLEMLVRDSHLTGRTDVGRASLRLPDLIAAQNGAEGGKVTMWVSLSPPASSYTITSTDPVPTGEVLVELTYKAFDDDEQDSGYREAENHSKQAAAQGPITDIRSAAAASSRAAVAASAAVSAIAMTKAAAARAAARAARAAQEAAAAAAVAAKGAVDQGASLLPSAAVGAKASTLPSASAVEAVVAGASDVESVAVAAARQRLRVLAAEAEAAKAAEAVSAAAKAAAEAASGGNGKSALSHTVAADGSAASLRVRVPGGKDSDDDGQWPGGGSGGSSGAGFAGVDRTALATEARAARSSVAAIAMGAAVLPAGAAGATTVVLERPPARASSSTTTMEEVVLSGGNGSSSHDGGRTFRNGRGGGGDQRQPGDGDSDANGGGDGNGNGATSHLQAGAQARHMQGAAVDRRQLLQPGEVEDEQDWQSSSRRHYEDQEQQQQYGGSGNGTVDASAEAAAPPGAAPAAAVASGGMPIFNAIAGWASASAQWALAPFGGAKQAQQELPEAGAAAAKDSSGSSNVTSGSGGGTAWLDAITSRLPRYKAHNDQEEAKAGGGSKDGSSDAAAAAAVAAAQEAVGEGGKSASGEDRSWWQFWESKSTAAKVHDGAAASSATDADDAAGSSATSSSANGAAAAADKADGEGKAWWKFWYWGGGDKSKAKGGEGGGGQDLDLVNKPVDSIYIPADLPLEEIAAEVQRLKEDNWRERSDHVSNLWMKAVEKNDRKWIMLAAFLLSVAVGLLTVVAWRLEQLEHLQAVAPQIALMSMQAALQVLEEQARNGGAGM